MTIITLATGNLRVSPRNVRKAGPGDLAELVASIVSTGLIHPLAVTALPKPEGKVTHEIVAGSRRFAAIKRAIKAGQLPKSHAIRCEVVGEDAAAEISLAENIVRTAMHPADQFEAFRDMIDRGLSVAEVAARFGVSESLVTRRMKLGRVSPVLLAAFRAGRIGLDMIGAYALTDDTERQERLYRENPIADSWKVKEWLLEGQVPVTDRRVAFVGLDAYRAAGGALTLDLLSELEERYSASIADVELLDRLVMAKLDDIRQAVAAEGWKWTEVALNGFDHGQFPERVYSEARPLSNEERAEKERLYARYHELIEAGYTHDEAATTEIETLEAAIGVIEGRERGYAPEDMARAGAVVMIGWGGEARIERGLVRKEDAKPGRAAADADTDDDEDRRPAADQLPARLVSELSAIRTGIIAATLMNAPHVALAATVHALALKLFFPLGGASALDLRAMDVKPERCVDDPGRSDAFAALAAGRERWDEILPDGDGDLFRWCVEQEDSRLLDLLAFCAALAVNATLDKGECAGPRHRAADALADALEVKPEDWTSAGRLGVFERAPKRFTLSVLRATVGDSRAENIEGLKKAPFAEAAAQSLDGRWLPDELLRALPASPPSADGSQTVAE